MTITTINFRLKYNEQDGFILDSRFGNIPELIFVGSQKRYVPISMARYYYVYFKNFDLYLYIPQLFFFYIQIMHLTSYY